jgi:hypothetical protein
MFSMTGLFTAAFLIGVADELALIGANGSFESHTSQFGAQKDQMISLPDCVPSARHVQGCASRKINLEGAGRAGVTAGVAVADAGRMIDYRTGDLVGEGRAYCL